MSQRDKSRLALNNITAGVREPGEWSAGPSDIEGKATRVGASECGQRTSFNRTGEITPLCGKPKSREQNRCTSGSVSREPRQSRGCRGKRADVFSQWGRWLNR